MKGLIRRRVRVFAVSLLLLIFSTPVFALTDEPGKEASIFSPVIQVVPDHNGKGFLRVSTDGGVIWLEATAEAKPHLEHLPVGGLIDVKILFRGKPNPPLIQSWKLASGEPSACPIFDGKTCVKNKPDAP